MNTSKKILFNVLILFGLAIMLFSSCDLDNRSEMEIKPDISTLRLTDITATSVFSGGNIAADEGTIVTAIVEVTNPITGRIWMDRNLGASRAAISSTDSEGYGDLYQWGRGTDGHEKRDSPTTSNFSSSNSPGHGSFIQTHTERAYYDWRRPRNNNLWQGVNGENNPCPPGFRLPTEAELIAEFSSWGTKDAAGAFASPLKLPLSGNRSSSGGTLFNAGIFGVYWSSTVNGAEARLIAFNNSDVNVYTSYRAYGLSVRCIKD